MGDPSSIKTSVKIAPRPAFEQCPQGSERDFRVADDRYPEHGA